MLKRIGYTNKKSIEQKVKGEESGAVVLGQGLCYHYMVPHLASTNCVALMITPAMETRQDPDGLGNE